MFQLVPYFLFNYSKYVVFFEIGYCHVFRVYVTNNYSFFNLMIEFIGPVYK
jgi:hypothetical protein